MRVETGPGGDLGEASTSEIAAKDVAGNAGDEEIDETVIIRGGGHRIALAGQAGFLRYVGEGEVADVPEQAVGVLPASLAQTGDGRAIGEEHVGATIVIKVERVHAARASTRSGGAAGRNNSV